MTMKATFFLRNLSFDTSDFAGSKLFTIDEEYFRQRLLNFHQPNPNLTSPSPNSAAQTLKEIYKMCEIEGEEEEEDSDSLERANALFQEVN